MTNLQQYACKRCGEGFYKLFAEQLYCNICRRVMVSAETASITKQRRLEIAKAETVEEKFTHLFDVRVIDEWGQEVWALQLAKRYRKELNARQQRDFRHRK